MAGRKIVVALGGNAILTNDASAKAQQSALRKTAASLVQFVEQGDQLVISHGNGPQVGNLLLQQAAGSTEKNPAMPIDSAVSMTQGSIGYWLQNAMDEALAEKDLDKSVATVVTQVEVDADDQAFTNPTKPIGPFYEADEVAQQRLDHPQFTFVEDAGRGYRRVVPSPKPIGVVEADVINQMVDANIIPISVGGGGIPVVKDGSRYIGREAVIDKDFASEKLAELIHADLLIILTAVDNVYVNFNQANQQKLTDVTVEELSDYIEEKQFAPGSMLPKIQAAMDFVNHSDHGKTVITSLDNVGEFLTSGAGTTVMKTRDTVLNK
ncbi:Carbamate kinase [Furfurilactobacillus rossiae]|uniref:carbamate kinase n=1 Tax=Furfurilactobacillus rossiae TaxID=231049 RepID=UPI0015BC584E|nr:carbamate kinase [Furfurilactobacillus rossiae]MCF6166582.1 carbamate kinase [Furfurilactobacillus rossiae]QLE64328.1 Carbamate kinase [Furfurilactobacillus rossiae]